MTEPARVDLGKVFHLSAPRMKHEENSDRGDHEAVRTGCDSSDHDWQKDADGVTQNTHWERPCERDGFFDPLHKISHDAQMRHLSSDAVARLVAVTNGHEFHIRTAAQGIRHAAKVGLKAVRAEAKPGNVWTVQDFRYHKRVADRAGIALVIATMDNWPGWRQTLRNARAAGCDTRRLRQG